MKRRKKICLSAFALLLIVAVAGGVIWWKLQIHWGPTFGATSPEEWVEAAVAHANAFKPKPWSKRPKVFSWTHATTGADCFELWLEGSGLVTFQDGNWAYIVTHSFHQDETHWIGDICVARDSQGGLWRCDAHSCSCICLQPESREGFRDLDEFLEKPVDDKKWERLTLPNKELNPTNEPAAGGSI